MNKIDLHPARRTIIARVEDRTYYKDKYSKDFMLLKINNDNPIFAFPGKVDRLKWGEIEIGGEYKFIVEEGKNSNNLLISFEKRG